MRCTRPASPDMTFAIRTTAPGVSSRSATAGANADPHITRPADPENPQVTALADRCGQFGDQTDTPSRTRKRRTDTCAPGMVPECRGRATRGHSPTGSAPVVVLGMRVDIESHATDPHRTSPRDPAATGSERTTAGLSWRMGSVPRRRHYSPAHSVDHGIEWAAHFVTDVGHGGVSWRVSKRCANTMSCETAGQGDLAGRAATQELSSGGCPPGLPTT